MFVPDLDVHQFWSLSFWKLDQERQVSLSVILWKRGSAPTTFSASPCTPSPGHSPEPWASAPIRVCSRGHSPSHPTPLQGCVPPKESESAQSKGGGHTRMLLSAVLEFQEETLTGPYRGCPVRGHPSSCLRHVSCKRSPHSTRPCTDLLSHLGNWPAAGVPLLTTAPGHESALESEAGVR